MTGQSREIMIQGVNYSLRYRRKHPKSIQVKEVNGYIRGGVKKNQIPRNDASFIRHKNDTTHRLQKQVAEPNVQHLSLL